jgi:hypothetical protein
VLPPIGCRVGLVRVAALAIDPDSGAEVEMNEIQLFQ